MQRSDKVIDAYEMNSLLNLRVTHKRAPVPILEALNFKDAKESSREIRDLPGVKECVLIQTCNRVEIHLSLSDEQPATLEWLIEYWRWKTGFKKDEIHRYVEVARSLDVVKHMLKLTSGLESMVVGEDQILAQVQDAYIQAREFGAVGPVLRKVFEKSVKVGKMVRVKTNVNKGAVSIGSISVNLLEELAGDLAGKRVLIVGAGNIGEIAGKALAARNLTLIFVANRTYEKAVSLSKMLNAEAVKFDRLGDLLATVDIAVVATSAPHCIITRSKVEEALSSREKGRRLLIIDLSQPRNVEKEVADLPDVEVHNIDNLRSIAEKNLKMRLQEAEKAELLIQSEIDRIVAMQKTIDVKPIINAVSRRANEIRRRELEKAYCLMVKPDPKDERCAHCRRVMENFSKHLMEKMMVDPISNLMNAEIDRDFDKIAVIQEVFKVNPTEAID